MGKTLGTYFGEITAASGTLDQTDKIPCLEDGSLRMAVPPQVNTAALWLPGSSGNYVSCPDSASLDIVGDITFVAKVALDVWTPALSTTIVAKRQTTTTNSYRFGVFDSGGRALFVAWTTNGLDASQIIVQSTASPVVSNGSALWIAATLDVNNGAAGNDTRFWTSADGETWTQLGTTVTTATATSLFSSTSAIEIGSITAGTELLLGGKVYEVSVRSGIGTAGVVGGTEVLNYKADLARGQRYRDAYGNLFTHNGSAWALMAA
jgi:hypothetical protein